MNWSDGGMYRRAETSESITVVEWPQDVSDLTVSLPLFFHDHAIAGVVEINSRHEAAHQHQTSSRGGFQIFISCRVRDIARIEAVAFVTNFDEKVSLRDATHYVNFFCLDRFGCRA